MAERDKGRIVSQDDGAILSDNQTQPQFFVEGIGQLSFGPAVSKISYFKVISSETKGALQFEKREIALEVIIEQVSSLFGPGG